MKSSRIPLIAGSEFRRRVTTKGFVITTLLGPIALLAFFGVVGVISVRSMESESRSIVLVDETGVLANRLLGGELTHADGSVDSARAAVLSGMRSAYLHLPRGLLLGEAEPVYYSTEGGGLGFENDLEYRIERALESHRLEQANVSPEILEILDTNVSLTSIKLTTSGEEAGSTWAYSALGGLMGFLIYITMLVYGSVVMYGVIEEKSSRIVEVIISSVRPFELLMGKVLGIGAMGLVQLSVWALLIFGGTLLVGVVIGMTLDPAALELPETASRADLLAAADITLPSLSADVFVWFVLYFLFGYLLYAGMFAAVGSMVEQQQDTQGLILPVMMPIILSIVFISPILESPNSSLAVTMSLIPLTSPVPMVVRLAVTDVPMWEVLLSFSLLVGSFLVVIWVSSRIYRVGVLMYGKKATFRDVIRWLRVS